MHHVPIKPISVNECWQGKRFRTPEYDEFIEKMIWLLPPITLPQPPFHIRFSFGFSSTASDIDNPLKPTLDSMQKKYRFNDKHVHRLTVEKVKVKKGQEFIQFQILPL